MGFKGALLKPSEKNPKATSRGMAKSRFETLKEQVRGWWDDRFKTGEALREIRDSALYREGGHATFEDFCEAEFNLKRAQAYRLIEAAAVKESVKMSPIGDKLVHESQARALAPVPAAERSKVLEEVAERGPVTAKAITATVQKTKPAVPEKHLDKTGYPIPDEILLDWRTAESFSDTLSQLHRIKLRVEKALEESDLAFREITNSAVSEIESAWRDLQRVLPYVVCPTCQGRTRGNCTLCKQRGFISQFGYERWIPKATRELREKAINK